MVRAIFDAMLGVVPYGSAIDIRVSGEGDSATVTWEHSDVLESPTHGSNQEVMAAIWVAREMAHRAGGRLETSDEEAMVALCTGWRRHA